MEHDEKAEGMSCSARLADVLPSTVRACCAQGSGLLKAGFAGAEMPKVLFPA